MYISHEYRNLSPGDKVIVEHNSRWSYGAELGEIERVTETSFWVEGKRYTKNWGKRFGDGSFRAIPFSQEKWDEHERRRKAKAREERAKQDAANEAEHNARVEFGCDHIVDEKAQELLRNLRNLVISSQRYIERVVERANETTVEKPWPLYHQMTDGDHERYITAVQQYDLCKEMHHRLVETADDFYNGAKFELRRLGDKVTCSKESGTELSFVLKHDFRAMVLRRLQEYVRTSRPRVGDREIIDHLMDACGLRWGLEYTLRPVKEDE